MSTKSAGHARKYSRTPCVGSVALPHHTPAKMKMLADIDLWDAKQKIGGEIRKIKQLWDADHIPVED